MIEYSFDFWGNINAINNIFIGMLYWALFVFTLVAIIKKRYITTIIITSGLLVTLALDIVYTNQRFVSLNLDTLEIT